MTNPNANDLLRLARAVYPGRAYEVTTDLRYGFNGAYVSGEKFDPANNSEQFVEVMAWLLGQDSMNQVDWYGVDYLADGFRCIPHNGTPAGIRAAVVEAAVRVAGGGQ